MGLNQKSLKNKILLVEDDLLVAELTTIYLNEYGFLVYHVVCGEDAITKLCGNTEIDLVLMDIELGVGINGFETAKEIQKTSNIPIIFHSSHLEPEYIKQARQISRYGYVIKDGKHYVLLNQAIHLALSIFELYEIHKLKSDYKKHIKTDLKNSIIIAAISDLELEYTWINNPHPDFILENVIGKNDIQIIKNEGTEELYQFKKEILKTAGKKIIDIKFPLSTGNLIYEVKGSPLLLNETEVLGVKTISVLK